MTKDDSYPNKRKGRKDSKRSHEMSSSAWNNKGKDQGRLWNLSARQNFGGCCRCYNRFADVASYSSQDISFDTLILFSPPNNLMSSGGDLSWLCDQEHAII